MNEGINEIECYWQQIRMVQKYECMATTRVALGVW